MNNNNSYSLSLYEKALPDDMELENKIITSSQLGFDSCEVCIDMNPLRIQRLHWSEMKLYKLNSFIEKSKIKIPTLSLSALRGCPLGTIDRKKNREALSMIENACIFCKRIGVQIILINAYDVFEGESTKETVERFRQNIIFATEIAEKYEIVLALENAEKKFGDTIEKVAFWVKSVNSPFLKIYYDPANAYNAFIGSLSDVKNDFYVGKDEIVAVHLKDSVIGEYRMTPYGEGQVDFSNIISMLQSAGLKQYTAELFLRNDKEWDIYARWVNDFLRSFFEKNIE